MEILPHVRAADFADRQYGHFRRVCKKAESDYLLVTSVRLSVLPHGTSGLPLDGLS
jgi:hypothetical protein